MKKKILLKADYVAKVDMYKERGYTHWLNDPDRWEYHYLAIQFARKLSIDMDDKVLEIGALGVQIYPDSDTLDIPTSVWKGEEFNPTYCYNVNDPLPFEDKAYKTIVALQVLHCVGDRNKVMDELIRVADNVIVSMPNRFELDPGKYTESKQGKKVTVYLYRS